MNVEFEVSDRIPASADEIYSAWLNSDQHSRMTGSPAHVTDEVGEAFDAWDGYIRGENLELEPSNRIVQSWRTVEFSEDEENSLLEVTLEPVEGGTQITIRHSQLPSHGTQYEQGWVDSYFTPMKQYFGDR